MRPILYDYRSVNAMLRYRPRLSVRRYTVTDPDKAQLRRDCLAVAASVAFFVWLVL